MTPTEIEALGDERRVLYALWNMTLGKVGKTAWYDPREGIDCTVSEETHERWVTFERKIDAGAYLDAAMMLVPEGWHIEIKGPRKYLNIPSPVPNYWSANVETWSHEVQKMGWGATPALALCAAIARAGGE